MKLLLILSALIVFITPVGAQMLVAESRFLSTSEGKPFFWLGDTDWELFHRLTREEANELINVRSSQGFNLLQAVALAEFNGIREPNRYGDYPLNNEDPTQLLITPGNDTVSNYEYDYWDHVDYIIEKAASKGMYIGLLPTWGDKVTNQWGEGPVIFNVQNAEVFGELLATRYKKYWNVVWILGGDRPAVYQRNGQKHNDIPLWRAMATGIERVLGEQAFITYHPAGGSQGTSSHLHHEPWLDMNTFQSGHGSRESDPWNWVTRDLEMKPSKPTLDMEPCYEDHPVNPWDGKWTKDRGYFTAYDVRARIYRGVFAGACGVSYGHHQVWQFLNRDLYDPINPGDTIIGWQKAIHAPAAKQMIHLKNLMLSRPYFTRVSDQSIIASPIGKTYLDFIVATRDKHRSYAMVYLPQNKSISIDLSKISGVKRKIWWYNPETGQAFPDKETKAKKILTLSPPRQGKDWVLVIDDASKNYGTPGAVTPSDQNSLQK